MPLQASLYFSFILIILSLKFYQQPQWEKMKKFLLHLFRRKLSDTEIDDHPDDLLLNHCLDVEMHRKQENICSAATIIPQRWSSNDPKPFLNTNNTPSWMILIFLFKKMYIGEKLMHLPQYWHTVHLILYLACEKQNNLMSILFTRIKWVHSSVRTFILGPGAEKMPLRQWNS